MLVDAIKVRHWMNARKVTTAAVAGWLGLSEAGLAGLLGDGDATLGDDLAGRLADVLGVDLGQLSPRGNGPPGVIVMTAAEMARTRRPLQRDGIHFYNYYSMAAPFGHAGPVILDILCPPGRPPALNNGHLEPAITVNLGPGDITGRWGTELNADTWRVMAANHAADSWIAGDSYVEPTYCPHSYGLAGEAPARIISYTAAAPLGPLVETCDAWPDEAFSELLAAVGDGTPGSLAAALLSRRGYDPAAADQAAGLPPGSTAALVDGTREPDLDTARKLGAALGFDYRMLLPPDRQHDAVGKTYWPVERSRATTRPFRGYTVASMAGAAHLTDLVGMFMRVDRGEPGPGEAAPLDLTDLAETHYLVTSGSATLWWREPGGGTGSARLGADDSAWAGPCVAHGWTGSAAVVRLGSGPHVSYLDQFELSNTYEPRQTLTRARRDRMTWGYDTAETR